MKTKLGFDGQRQDFSSWRKEKIRSIQTNRIDYGPLWLQNQFRIIRDWVGKAVWCQNEPKEKTIKKTCPVRQPCQQVYMTGIVRILTKYGVGEGNPGCQYWWRLHLTKKTKTWDLNTKTFHYWGGLSYLGASSTSTQLFSQRQSWVFNTCILLLLSKLMQVGSRTDCRQTWEIFWGWWKCS